MPWGTFWVGGRSSSDDQQDDVAKDGATALDATKVAGEVHAEDNVEDPVVTELDIAGSV